MPEQNITFFTLDKTEQDVAVVTASRGPQFSWEQAADSHPLLECLTKHAVSACKCIKKYYLPSLDSAALCVPVLKHPGRPTTEVHKLLTDHNTLSGQK